MVSGPLLLLGLALPVPYGAGTASCRGFSDIQAPAMVQELNHARFRCNGFISCFAFVSCHTTSGPQKQKMPALYLPKDIWCVQKVCLAAIEQHPVTF
jgi:hypothetical protein